MQMTRLAAGLLPALAAALLAACHGDSTGPTTHLQLSPGAARPYSVVDVGGLPAAYETGQPLDVTVGGVHTTLTWDPVTKVHSLVVPQVAAGDVQVAIPATAAGQKPLTATLQVLPAQYRGGSPEAALSQLNQALDSMQVTTELGLRVLSPDEDSVLYARLDASVVLAEELQAQIATLPASARPAVAAAYTENADLFDSLDAIIAQGLAQLDSLPPTIGASASKSFASSVGSGDALVRRCQERMSTLKRLDEMKDRLDRILLAVNVTVALMAPEAEPIVGLMTAKLLMTFDIALLITNMRPDLLVPDGLVLQTDRPSIPEDGGTGHMGVRVQRRAAGEVLGSARGVAMGLAAPFQALQEIEEMRGLADMALVRAALKSIGKDELFGGILDLLDGVVKDYVGRAIGQASGDAVITFEGVQITAGASPHWEFTDGPATASRGIRTVGKISGTTETVTLAATLGSGSECTATTGLSSPAAGVNGFEISSKASLKFAGPGSTEVRAGETGAAQLTLTNEGDDAAGGITYRLELPGQGAWTPPAWLQVQPSGPGTLQSRQSGTVFLDVAASSTAPERTVVVPVVAVLPGKVAASTTVTVDVRPQLSDVVVNRSQSVIRLWDHGVEDGDIVTVTLNGAPLATGFTLTNAGNDFPVQYRRGTNVLVIRALNEGDLPPNTASVGLADVVRGDPEQGYDLPTGGVAELVITYDPNATPDRIRPSRLPAPRLRACPPGRSGDCAR